MTLRVVRTLIIASAAVGLSFPVVAGAASGGLTTDRGIVQSVSATELVLRGLDGSAVSIAVGPSTRVKLNGRPALLANVQPGFVASVVHNGSRPAVVVRAFGKVASVTDQGVVTALTPATITLRTQDGAQVTIALDAGTRFRRFGLPVRAGAARPGALVAVTHPVGGAARVVSVLKRA